MKDFELDPRLAADSHWLADQALCQVRLMDDIRFPWLVLVPRVAGAVEWFDLAESDQHLLFDEVSQVARLLRERSGCEKINIGALGNIVRQLHVHVLARSVGDAAWPGPVWGNGEAQRFTPAALETRLAELRLQLAGR
ncbi:MAG: diadenosine tetraphosphate hydrolase [Gammaproteobacteria bacterium RIFCSPHIGHO2_12_FULL_63_22]|nr:MAG: diadenosine tetraphosphate hydrolase [Gammaproteobacteria bacterium RIFCSPHIGHO2_12_FULL_63_22]